MELNTSFKIASLFQKKESEPALAKSIFSRQVHLLFEQHSFGIIAQFFAAIFLVIALWSAVSNFLLISWFSYMITVYSLWLATTMCYQQRADILKLNTWLTLTASCTFLAGLGWGAAGSILMPANHLNYQIFVIILIFGITASSIPFFSPVISMYALFLFPAFIPFNFWLFAQGHIYFILGLCGLIYMFIMFVSCYHLNKFLINTLALHFKNINLDTLNQLLEQRVNKRADELEKALAITKSTLESTADGILVVDLNGQIDYYNQKFLDMWQMPKSFATRPNLKLFIKEVLSQIHKPKEFLSILDKINANPSHESFDEVFINENKIFEWYSKPHWMRNLIVGRTWSFRDITIRKQMERQLTYQANHDLLTGLPNRTLLYDRITQGIAYAKRYQTKLYLLFFDIDNFKLINDNLGHNLGDILLQKIAKRLKFNTRESDTVSRFGGDEFVVLFISNKYSDVLKLTQKILKTITKPIQLQNHEIVVTASIGSSVYPKDGEDAATLLKSADMAMYLAKNQGGNNVKLYDSSMKQHTEKSLAMQIELRNGLANDEFFILYQPTINLQTSEVIGVEALIRWKHPTKGVIQPLQFIPIAEESSIIVLLGEWIFRNACLQNKAWQDMGLKPVRMAINVSGIQLIRENFVELVKETLKTTQLDPRYIEIELTESVFMEDKKQNLSTLSQIKEMGINLSIDDFGTGYSSLHYLREFPVDKIKIDQSFVCDCTADSNDASLVEAIIAMGHGLKLKVLAEGIESAAQLRFLEHCRCDEGQGFLFGQPMSAKAFAKFLT